VRERVDRSAAIAREENSRRRAVVHERARFGVSCMPTSACRRAADAIDARAAAAIADARADECGDERADECADECGDVGSGPKLALVAIEDPSLAPRRSR